MLSIFYSKPPFLTLAFLCVSIGWASPDSIEGVCDIDPVSELGFVVVKESRTGRRGTLRVHNMASRKAHSSNHSTLSGGLNSPISEHGANGTTSGVRRHSSTASGVGSPNSSSSSSVAFNGTLGAGGNGSTNNSGGGSGALPAALEDRMRQYIPATITRVLDYARASSTPPTSGTSGGAGMASRRLSFNNDSAHHRNSYTGGGGGGADLDDALANETRRLVVVFLNLGLSEDEVRAAQYSQEGAVRMHAMMATVQRCCYRYQVRKLRVMLRFTICCCLSEASCVSLDCFRMSQYIVWICFCS